MSDWLEFALLLVNGVGLLAIVLQLRDAARHKQTDVFLALSREHAELRSALEAEMRAAADVLNTPASAFLANMRYENLIGHRGEEQQAVAVTMDRSFRLLHRQHELNTFGVVSARHWRAWIRLWAADAELGFWRSAWAHLRPGYAGREHRAFVRFVDGLFGFRDGADPRV